MNFKRIIPKDYGLEFTNLTPRDDTSRIVIHHTGNPTDDDLSAEQLHRSHLTLGLVRYRLPFYRSQGRHGRTWPS